MSRPAWNTAVDSLVRIADALMTAVLWLVALGGAAVAFATGNGVPLLVALAIVGAGVALGRMR